MATKAGEAGGERGLASPGKKWSPRHFYISGPIFSTKFGIRFCEVLRLSPTKFQTIKKARELCGGDCLTPSSHEVGHVTGLDS